MSRFFTYIIDAGGTYYTGWTTDLVRRLKQHNGLLAGGAKFTRGKECNLVWFQELTSRSSAMKLEAVIKKLSRDDKRLFTVPALYSVIYGVDHINFVVKQFRKDENDTQS